MTETVTPAPPIFVINFYDTEVQNIKFDNILFKHRHREQSKYSLISWDHDTLDQCLMTALHDRPWLIDKDSSPLEVSPPLLSRLLPG